MEPFKPCLALSFSLARKRAPDQPSGLSTAVSTTRQDQKEALYPSMARPTHRPLLLPLRPLS